MLHEKCCNTVLQIGAPVFRDLKSLKKHTRYERTQLNKLSEHPLSYYSILLCILLEKCALISTRG